MANEATGKASSVRPLSIEMAGETRVEIVFDPDVQIVDFMGSRGPELAREYLAWKRAQYSTS